MNSFLDYFEQAENAIVNLRVTLAGEDLQINSNARSMDLDQFKKIIARTITSQAIKDTDFVKTKDPSGAIIEIDMSYGGKKIKLGAVAETPDIIVPIDSVEINGSTKRIKRAARMKISKFNEWVVEVIQSL